MTDLKRLYLLQGLRAFAYGFGSVTLGAALAESGLTGLEVGTVFAALLAGSALMSLFLVRHAERIGRRRAYMFLYALMGVTGMVFAYADALPLLLIAALTGTVSVDVVESGPFTSLEQAMIPQVAGVGTPHAFGVYNAVASLVGAAGALAAGGPEALRHLGVAAQRDARWLLVYPVVALAAIMVARRLSGAVESERPASPAAPLAKSRKPVMRMAGLFALDSFAGGFIVQSFIVYWFTRHFGASTQLMGAVLAATGVIQAASFLAAPRIARRFGLLNTMVFTHLPSNVLLMLIPLAPNLTLAWILLLVRFPLSQMDVPTRQAYLAALAPQEERAAAAGVTNAARTSARPFAAPLAGLAAGSGLPFFLAGGLKIVYDLLLLASFRHVKLDQGSPNSTPGRP